MSCSSDTRASEQRAPNCTAVSQSAVKPPVATPATSATSATHLSCNWHAQVSNGRERPRSRVVTGRHASRLTPKPTKVGAVVAVQVMHRLLLIDGRVNARARVALNPPPTLRAPPSCSVVSASSVMLMAWSPQGKGPAAATITQAIGGGRDRPSAVGHDRQAIEPHCSSALYFGAVWSRCERRQAVLV